jgi:hypothetical protein
LQADLTNIKSFIRVRHVTEDDGLKARELMAKCLFRAESWIWIFSTQLDEPLPAFADRFARDPWGTVVATG